MALSSLCTLITPALCGRFHFFSAHGLGPGPPTPGRLDAFDAREAARKSQADEQIAAQAQLEVRPFLWA